MQTSVTRRLGWDLGALQTQWQSARLQRQDGVGWWTVPLTCLAVQVLSCRPAVLKPLGLGNPLTSLKNCGRPQNASACYVSFINWYWPYSKFKLGTFEKSSIIHFKIVISPLHVNIIFLKWLDFPKLNNEKNGILLHFHKSLYYLAEGKAARFFYLLRYTVCSDRTFGLEYVKAVQPHTFGKGRTVSIAFLDKCGYSSLLWHQN